MADEPDNLILRLLREIRAEQQAQGDVLGHHTAVLGQHTGALSRLEKRVEDLYSLRLAARQVN